MADTSSDTLPARFNDCEQRLGVWWHLHPEPDGRINDLRNEALHRLGQSRWCLVRIQAIEREDCADGSSFDSSGSIGAEIQVVTEAFYYATHAFLKLSEKVQPLGLASFYKVMDGCDIIRVRNHFVEHTEKPSGSPGPHFSWCNGPGVGPKIKPFADSAHGPREEGLYLHAEVFAARLAKTLDGWGA